VPRVQAKIHDKEFRKKLRTSSAVVKGHVARRLSYWGRYIIKSIKGDHSIFKYKEGRSRRRGGGGSLTGGLWTNRTQGKLEQLMGWNVAHGEVMEFGPRFAKEWFITPKGFRSDVTSRGGGKTGLKFLRFKSRGKIRYAQIVKHVWDDGQKREHFKPHMKKAERGFFQDIGSIPKRVLEGKLR